MAKHRKARAVGFNHVVLEVGDIEEALAFYGRLFDFKLRGRSGDMAFIDLGDQFLALQKGRNQPADQGRHFGLVVDDKEAVEGVGRRGDPTVARTVSRLSRPLGQPHRDCKLRQRSIHQSVERAAMGLTHCQRTSKRSKNSLRRAWRLGNRPHHAAVNPECRAGSGARGFSAKIYDKVGDLLRRRHAFQQ